MPKPRKFLELRNKNTLMPVQHNYEHYNIYMNMHENYFEFLLENWAKIKHKKTASSDKRKIKY